MVSSNSWGQKAGNGGREMNTKTQNNRKLPLIFKIFTLFLFHFPPILELTKEKEKKHLALVNCTSLGPGSNYSDCDC